MTLRDRSEAGPGRSPAEATGVPVVDEAAFAAFYEAQVDGVLNFLARKAGRDDAAVLLSQTFEHFFVWWPENPEHPNPVATLYRIAGCRLNDHLRRSGRALSFEAGDLEEALACEDHRDEFAGVDLRVDLGQALAELTERERQALFLRYAANLPVKECAEVLGLGIDNLKKILKKALRTLRQSPRMDAYETAGTAKEARK